MKAHPDTFIADAKLRIEAELRERLDRQLELQSGAFDAHRLFDAVVRQYERDIEEKVERAQVNGNEELADALDRMQREILPDVVETLWSEYRA
jgi:bacterioferritin (cytochrome b1)